MSAHRQHGRRRATTPMPASVSRGRHWASAPESEPRNVTGRKPLALAVAAAGFIALTALPAAHADTGHLAASVTANAATSSLQPAVTADKNVVVSFAKPSVSSKPAPAAPPGGLHPAGAPAAPLPEPAQPAPTAQAPVQSSSGLRPPLASITVASPFGYRTNPLSGAGGELHTGLDLVATCSTAVFAAGSGTVTEAGWSQYGGGNRIVIDHGGGIKTTYNHLDSIGVSVGQQVGAGAQIAGVGSTGNSTGCHLHFEVMVNGQTVDPAPFI
ncbi:M23 family metallopeptidase [Arthrobacter cryoconiti]|uniref:M23 family metallopeptidase n=1 Tax=Arthrobacter cryoconiti TaxID=748907 RepID=A0ABV8R4U7_9MICC|nr:M23 family metallopeptidase [Arthrobacter cryoconiti]MCC9069378.1 M23 family metallopeptidase [Arthrobacter cryoconiti]